MMHHLEQRIAELEHHIHILNARISEMFQIGTITANGIGTNNAITHQVQINGLQTLGPLTHAETFGMTSMPPIGSLAIVVHPGGQVGAGSFIVATQTAASRPKTLTPGSTSLYDANNNSIAMSEGKMNFVADKDFMLVANGDGTISAQGKMTITGGPLEFNSTGEATFNGDLNIVGVLKVNGVVVVVP
jgi:phage gp45-like